MIAGRQKQARRHRHNTETSSSSPSMRNLMEHRREKMANCSENRYMCSPHNRPQPTLDSMLTRRIPADKHLQRRREQNRRAQQNYKQKKELQLQHLSLELEQMRSAYGRAAEQCSTLSTELAVIRSTLTRMVRGAGAEL